MCSVDGAQKEVRRRLTFTEHQYLPVRHNSDCAHCIDEETEAQRSEMPGLGLQSGKSLASNSGLTDSEARTLLEKPLG